MPQLHVTGLFVALAVSILVAATAITASRVTIP
jgi:hypothetical protein